MAFDQYVSGNQAHIADQSKQPAQHASTEAATAVALFRTESNSETVNLGEPAANPF